jgi:hypothetical protein
VVVGVDLLPWWFSLNKVWILKTPSQSLIEIWLEAIFYSVWPVLEIQSRNDRYFIYIRHQVNIIQLMPAHLRWTIMMFTLSAGINCFIILKLYFFCITLISFDKCEHFCKWTARLVPLGTPAVAILYILTPRTRFKSWSFYRYRKRFGDLDHCSPGHQEKTDDRWKRENKELRIY